MNQIFFSRQNTLFHTKIVEAIAEIRKRLFKLMMCSNESKEVKKKRKISRNKSKKSNSI